MSLVQPIVVKPSNHFDTVAAVALASGLSVAKSDLDSVPWSDWLAGSFTKSVRRAKRAADLEHVRSLNSHSAEFVVGEAVALSFPPQPYDEMPKVIRRLQVSGLDASREQAGYSLSGNSIARLEVNSDVPMSTGKTAAQVAHALVAWLLAQPAGIRSSWVEAPGLVISETSFAAETLGPGDLPVITIVDNGLTEIEPGTETVRAFLE